MCIFTSQAEVSNTRIIVAARSIQGVTNVVVAYQMDAVAAQANAMVLPVPGFDLEVHDGESATPVLDWLQQVAVPTARSMGSPPVSSIPIQRVGGYNVSIAPSIQDIARLDPVLFSEPTSPSGLQSQLQKHYGGDEQFLVARLDGAEHYRPLLFSYKTRGDMVLVPTLHLHQGGEVPEHEEYDHEIFLLTEGMGLLMARAGRARVVGFPPRHVENLQSALKAAGGPLGALTAHWPAMTAWRSSIRGLAHNQDHYLVPG